MAIKILFLAILNPRSSIAKSIYDCRLSDVHKLCLRGENALVRMSLLFSAIVHVPSSCVQAHMDP